jgi:hypothetical protein
MNDRLFMNEDSEELREQIRDLIKRGYPVQRPTVFHVKIGPINYYPSRGKITADPCQKFAEAGYDALLKILVKQKVRTKLNDWSRKFEYSPEDLQVQVSRFEIEAKNEE